MIKSQRFGTGQKRTSLWTGYSPEVDLYFTALEEKRAKAKKTAHDRKAAREHKLAARKFSWQ
jgi:hypothetical protein